MFLKNTPSRRKLTAVQQFGKANSLSHVTNRVPYLIMMISSHHMLELIMRLNCVTCRHLVGEIVLGLEDTCTILATSELSFVPLGSAIRHHGDLSRH